MGSYDWESGWGRGKVRAYLYTNVASSGSLVKGSHEHTAATTSWGEGEAGACNRSRVRGRIWKSDMTAEVLDRVRGINLYAYICIHTYLGLRDAAARVDGDLDKS